MATASYFEPTKCLALGLNVPYLPEPICREFQFHTDADLIFTEETFKQPYVLFPVLSLLAMTWPFVFSQGIAYYVPEGPVFRQENPKVYGAIETDCRRSFLRGVYGQAYEMLNSTTNQQWQDPRTIQTKCVAVWYAQDDSVCPPEHGKWLADWFHSKQQQHGQEESNLQCHVKLEKVGLGHFTYFSKENQENGIMTRKLLELMGET